jgi:hypothetical protein
LRLPPVHLPLARVGSGEGRVAGDESGERQRGGLDAGRLNELAIGVQPPRPLARERELRGRSRLQRMTELVAQDGFEAGTTGPLHPRDREFGLP